MPTTTQTGAPGIYSTEQLIGPIPGPSSSSPSVAGFLGEHWRGPSVAVQCNGWQDFIKFFGGFQIGVSGVPVLNNTLLPYSVYEFFANGGKTAWIGRILASVTPGASASTTLADAGATPNGTLTLTAGVLGVIGNIGTWGNNLYVDVVTNPSGAGRFNLNIYYNPTVAAAGATAPFLVEQWIDLSMNPTDPRYVVTILNSAIQGSVWVVATNLFNAAVAPNNAPIPVTGKQFTGGVDTASPSVTDRANAVTYNNVSPIPVAPFDLVNGVLNINMPGESTQSVITAAIAYSGARPFTFLAVDPPQAQTTAGAVSYIQEFSAQATSNAAFYYPWVKASNPASPNMQSTILLPPGGFVLGQMVRTDGLQGPWVAPAGVQTALSNAVQAERQLGHSDLGTLNSNNVNALRTMANGNIVIWGTRTMLQGYASLYVPVRRTLNYIEATLGSLLEPLVFQPNDQMLWSNITKICNAFLSGLFAQNAFAGSTPATAYYTICDNTTNTPSTIANGVTNGTVGVALSTPAEFILLTIAQFQSSGLTTVTAQ